MGVNGDRNDEGRTQSANEGGQEEDELIHEMSRLDISCVGDEEEEESVDDSATGEEGTANNKPGFIGEEYELDYLSTKAREFSCFSV